MIADHVVQLDKPLVRFSRVVRQGRLDGVHKIHIDLTFVLGRYLPAILAHQKVFHQFVGGARDIDPSRYARRLETAGGVYGVSPNIVGKFLASDYSSYQRTGVDSE